MSTEVEHAHSFAYPCTRCDCGMTLAEARQLRDDETAGRPHAAETTKPIDRHGKAVDEPLPISGRLIITWPRKPLGTALHPVELEFRDADTGMPIVTILRVDLHFGFGGGDDIRNNMLIAELTMCCDEDGKPLIAKSERESLVERYGPDGYVLAKTFNFIVVESRLRP